MIDAQVANGPPVCGPRPCPITDATDRALLERFARGQDGAAFKALVQRHGPMVLGVCRRILVCEQDAEDAFQATFLILVRRAGDIKDPELLGSWLYGVASRTATKARARGARRREHERQAAPAMLTTDDPSADLAWRELRTTLDEELNRLPDKYRLPLILCYLEGLTNEEAARRLGWPPGSMSYRLARGRELLRERMENRRRQAPAGFFALLLALRPEGGFLPDPLIDTTVQAAVGLAGGQTGTVLVSPAVGSLVEASLRHRGGRWLTAALALLLATAALVFGGSLLSAGSPAETNFSPPPPARSDTHPTPPAGGSCHPTP
jgi:RNA polymerase sigma factor (sigma-70 family)